MKTDTIQPVIMFYGGGWPTNIGNAVIGLGAIALLQAAAPKARVINLSGMPRWLFGDQHAHKALDVAGVCRCDLAVFAGMSHCEEFVRVNGPTILKLRERGVPVLLLYGTDDSVFGLSYADRLKALLPSAEGPFPITFADHFMQDDRGPGREDAGGDSLVEERLHAAARGHPTRFCFRAR